MKQNPKLFVRYAILGAALSAVLGPSAALADKWAPAPYRTANVLVPSMNGVNACESLGLVQTSNLAGDGIDIATAVISGLLNVGTPEADRAIKNYIVGELGPCFRPSTSANANGFVFRPSFYAGSAAVTSAALTSGHKSALCARNEEIMRGLLADLAVSRTKPLSAELAATLTTYADDRGRNYDIGLSNMALLALGSQCEVGNEVLKKVQARLTAISSAPANWTAVEAGTEVTRNLDSVANCRPALGRLYRDSHLASRTPAERIALDAERVAFVQYLRTFAGTWINGESSAIMTSLMRAQVALVNPLLRGTTAAALDHYLLLLAPAASLARIDPAEVAGFMQHLGRVYALTKSEGDHSLNWRLRQAMGLTCARKSDPALVEYCVSNGTMPVIVAAPPKIVTSPVGQAARGTFEGIQSGYVVGWAFDPDTLPDATVVQIYDTPAGGVRTFVGEMKAEVPRTDVKNLQVGAFPKVSDRVGFKFPIPPALRNGLLHTISVQAKNNNPDGWVNLPLGTGAVATFTLPKPAASPAPAQSRTPLGKVLPIGPDGSVTGYAYDPDAPSHALKIRFVATPNCGGASAFLGEVVANFAYPAVPTVAPNPAIPGSHGFKFTIPAHCRDGVSRTLSAQAFDATPTVATPVAIGSAAFGLLDNNFLPKGVVQPIGADGIIRGYAYDDDAKSLPITVHIYRDGPFGSGTFVGSAVANAAVPAAPVTGNHGFAFRVPTASWDGVNHTYYVHGINATANALNPVIGSDAVLLPVYGKIAAKGWVDGMFGIIRDGIVSGWVVDGDDPKKSLEVEVYSNYGTPTAKLMGKTVAQYVRDNVRKEFGITEGLHGYKFLIPNEFRDGKNHEIAAFAVDSRDPGLKVRLGHYLLESTYKVFNSTVSTARISRSAATGSIDSYDLTTGTYRGWAYDGDDPAASLVVRFFADYGTAASKPMGSVKAFLLRSDIVTSNATGGGLHGWAFTIPKELRDGVAHKITALVSDSRDPAHTPALPILSSIAGGGMFTLAATSAFSPTSIPNLQAWYDAAALPVGPLAGAWADRSGKNLALATTATVRPNVVSAVYGAGAKNTVVFPGGYAMSNGALPAATVSTTFVVFAYTDAAATEKRVFRGPNGVMFGSSATTGGKLDLGYEGVRWSLTGRAPTLGAGLQMVRVVRSGTTTSTYFDRATVVANTMNAAFSATMPATGVFVGQFPGRLAEVIVYSGALTADQSFAVSQYLASKWGVR